MAVVEIEIGLAGDRLDRSVSKSFTLSSRIMCVSEVPSKLIKWEYKVILIRTQIHSDPFQAGKRPIIEDVQNDLNALGNEGWELVGVQDVTLPDERMFTVAYLKKPKR
jgi:hypothetical protein